MQYKTIGIIGAGVIGQALFNHIKGLEGIDVAFVLTSGRDGAGRDPAMAGVLTSDLQEALSRKVDLVLEAATPDMLASSAPQFLAHSDVCGFSCTALADKSVDAAIQAALAQSGRRFFVPHGAILGLDGLRDGRDQINEVVVTTTKSGKSFGHPADAIGTLFEGPTREVCARFPRNVNVHAAIALAGIGFDRTRSVVIADPSSNAMKHRITVSGNGLEWEINVSSISLGGVTGSYTPTSAVGSLERILGRSAFSIV